MNETNVLLVTDETVMAEMVNRVTMEIAGCTLVRLNTVEAVEPWIRRCNAAMILIHVTHAQSHNMNRLLRELQERSACVPMIVLSDFEDLNLKLRVIGLGAIDCLTRPLNLSRLALLVDIFTVRARVTASPATDVAALPQDEGTISIGNLLFDVRTHGGLLQQFRRVAPLDSTVLLTGPTGTGKTSVARLLHDLSPRKSQPFVVVHCGVSNPTLMASELFGHVRGAFTSADRDSTGKLTQAGDGTVLLDEIDCIPLDAQARLLHAVEERRYEAVGSLKTLRLRARLIVATNRDLKEEVSAGRFRADLYYRLNVFSFTMPSLAEGKALIEPLVYKLVAKFSDIHGVACSGVSSEALAALKRYHWPGNIRELRNVIEQAVAMCRQTIRLEDLPEDIESAFPACQYRKHRQCSQEDAEVDREKHCDAAVVRGPEGIANGLEHVRREAERKCLLDALVTHDNNRTEAAAELGISRVTFYKKLRQYGLT